MAAKSLFLNSFYYQRCRMLKPPNKVVQVNIKLELNISGRDQCAITGQVQWEQSNAQWT